MMNFVTLYGVESLTTSSGKALMNEDLYFILKSQPEKLGGFLYSRFANSTITPLWSDTPSIRAVRADIAIQSSVCKM